MKIVAGVLYKGKDVTHVGIYDIDADNFSVITTQEAKKLYKGNRLRCVNADFLFYVTQVNFLIGEQSQYPHIYPSQNKTPILEDGVLIYDVNKQPEGYKTIVIHNNQFKNVTLPDNQLIQLRRAGYKANFLDDRGIVKIICKDSEGNVKEIEDKDYVLKPVFEKWYKLDDNLRMVKVSECTAKEFTAEGIKIIDGFKDSDIEEVDLTGAKIIASRAFEGCHKLRKVILSNSLEQIHARAFADCPQLKELVIPESVQHIGERMYTRGTVYLPRRYEDAINPFTKDVKIVMLGTEKEVQEVKTLYNRAGKLYCLTYNLQHDNGKPITVNKAIKQSDIDIMDSYINYKDGKVIDGTGCIIICRNGGEYIFLDTSDYKLKQEGFHYFTDKKILDGIITGEEILPLEKEWGWYFVNKGLENKATTKIAGEIANTADTGNVLTDEQKMLISDYISEKCISKLGNFTIVSAKLDAKCKEEQAKYPGYVWKFRRVVFGGLSGSDNPKKYDKNGQPILRDVNGNFFCYFGHGNTVNHWVIDGYKDGQLMKTFTFGRDCAQHFTGMSDEDMQKIIEYDNKMSKAIKEITTVIKNNSLKQYVESYNLFYSILLGLKNKGRIDLLGPTGKYACKCIDLKMPVPVTMMDDIVEDLTSGSYNKNKIYCEDMLMQVVKNPKKLAIIYNNDDLYEASSTRLKAKTLEEVSKELDRYTLTHLHVAGATMKYINDYIENVKVDEEELKKADKIRERFLQLGLDKGFYLLNERYVIDTRKALILDRGSSTGLICNLSHPISDEDFNTINSLNKKDYRPIGKSKNIRIESAMYRGARILKDIVDVHNIPENEYRYVINLPSMVPKAVVGFAWKDNILAFFTRNISKPVHIIKDGEINFEGRYGIFENCEDMYGRCLPYSADDMLEDDRMRNYTLLSSKAESSDQIFNYKNEYKVGKGSLKSIIARDLAKFEKSTELVNRGVDPFILKGMKVLIEQATNHLEKDLHLLDKHNYIAESNRFIYWDDNANKIFMSKSFIGADTIKVYENIQGKIKVNKDYLTSNNYRISNIQLSRWHDNSWEVYHLDKICTNFSDMAQTFKYLKGKMSDCHLWKSGSDYLWYCDDEDTCYYNDKPLYKTESITGKVYVDNINSIKDLDKFESSGSGYVNLHSVNEAELKWNELKVRIQEEKIKQQKKNEMQAKLNRLDKYADKLEEIFKEGKSISNAYKEYKRWGDRLFDNYLQILLKASDKLDEYEKTKQQVSIVEIGESDHPLKQKLSANLDRLSEWDKDDPKYHDLHRTICEKYLEGQMLSQNQMKIVKKVFNYLKEVE